MGLRILTDLRNNESIPPPQSDPRYATKALLALTGTALLVNYVETMVIPGVPVIQRDLSTTATIASWITSSYLIVGSAVSPLFGKLGDMYGKKRMFLIALVFYIAGIGLAGFSPSIYVLIFARGLQGIGFAIIPLSLAIISDAFPRQKVGMAQGIISSTFAIGAAAGFVIGSIIVQDLGWQYAFHSALILSIFVFALIAKVLKKDVQVKQERLDYIGTAVLMTGVTLLLVYITEGPSIGWLSIEEIGVVIPGCLLTILFFLFEGKSVAPLIQLGILRVRNVLVANLVAILAGVSMFLTLFAVIYYAELPESFGLHLSVIGAALTLAPASTSMILGGPLIGRMTTRMGPKPVLFLGATLQIIAGLMYIINRATQASIASDQIVMLVGIVALSVSPVNVIAISLQPKHIAVGMGMNAMLRNLGAAVGPVVATSIMASYTRLYVGSQGNIERLPTSFAFDVIFSSVIAISVLIIILAATMKNYSFKKDVLTEAK